MLNIFDIANYYINKPLYYIYKKIFNTQINDLFKELIQNIIYVGIGSAITTIFSFIFNIFAGRLLGPARYGQYALIQSISMFLYIPMFFGLNTAMMKYNAEQDDIERQTAVISTTFLMVTIFVAISVFVYWFFNHQLAKLFSITSETLGLAIVFAIIYVFYTLANSTLSSLHKMKQYALFQPIFSFLLLLFFVIFLLFKFISYKAIVFSMYLAYIITGAAILINLRKYFHLIYDPYWINKLIRYGGYAIIGGASFSFYTNIDKIMINHYLTISDVGIYNAYKYVSVGIVGLLFNILNPVFFPFVSRYQNKEIIYTRINQLVPYLIGLGLPLIITAEFVILKMYGSKYPITPALLILFACAAIVILINGLYMWLISSHGRNGIKLTAGAELVSCIINIVLNLWLIPKYGISGAILSTIISYFVFMMGLIVLKNRFKNLTDAL